MKLHWKNPWWKNPWEDAVPVPIEELARCHQGLGELCGSAEGPFILTEEKILEHWREAGFLLDAYILPQPSGFHDIGIRYGNEGSQYLSPAGNRDKVSLLLDKYTSSGITNIEVARCMIVNALAYNEAGDKKTVKANLEYILRCLESPDNPNVSYSWDDFK